LRNSSDRQEIISVNKKVASDHSEMVTDHEKMAPDHENVVSDHKNEAGDLVGSCFWLVGSYFLAVVSCFWVIVSHIGRGICLIGLWFSHFGMVRRPDCRGGAHFFMLVKPLERVYAQRRHSGARRSKLK
jgi:hypothetical protein